MKYPSLLPIEKFDFLEEAEDEEDVLDLLTEHPREMLLFFELACEDQAWIRNENNFMKELLNWYSTEYFDGLLATDVGERAAETIRKNYQHLEPMIPKDLFVQVNDEMIGTNSLLFGTISSYLGEIIQKECYAAHSGTLTLEGGSPNTLEDIIEFAHTGFVKELWKKDEKTVLQELEEANLWGVKEFVAIAAAILVRYINKVNVYSMISMAFEREYKELKTACVAFLNEKLEGCQFRELPHSLEMRFDNLLEKTFDIFHKLQPLITHLAISHELPVESGFSELMKYTPSLQGLDLSETTHYTERYKDIPESVEELNLSMCSWLEDEHLRLFIQICPRIRVLTMKSVSQISHRGWATLIRLEGLEQLYIDRCYQIRDDDLLIIAQSAERFTHLSVAECDKITDRAFSDFARRAVKLEELNLSKTAIANEALIDIVHRCHKIRCLNLTRCLNISDKGVVEICRFESVLEEIDITGCAISEGAFALIQELRPKMTVVRRE
ncbi:MAG: hypothetical protein H7A37_02925 [Chlamydiales bacterium]|nr:hypothetical protein [Chlamydiia bacterium]MCP5507239.1 hypothetical protein [Chlamydiales bacterium]